MNKTRTTHTKMQDESGVALVEVLVAIIMLAGVLLSLAAATGHAARQLYYSSRDMDMWSALQSQVDSLQAAGFKDVSNGAATVDGYNVTWTVTGTDPKKVVVNVNFLTVVGDSLDQSVTMYFPSADTLRRRGDGTPADTGVVVI